MHTSSRSLLRERVRAGGPVLILGGHQKSPTLSPPLLQLHHPSLSLSLLRLFASDPIPSHPRPQSFLPDCHLAFASVYTATRCHRGSRSAPKPHAMAIDTTTTDFNDRRAASGLPSDLDLNLFTSLDETQTFASCWDQQPTALNDTKPDYGHYPPHESADPASIDRFTPWATSPTLRSSHLDSHAHHHPPCHNQLRLQGLHSEELQAMPTRLAPVSSTADTCTSTLPAYPMSGRGWDEPMSSNHRLATHSWSSATASSLPSAPARSHHGSSNMVSATSHGSSYERPWSGLASAHVMDTTPAPAAQREDWHHGGSFVLSEPLPTSNQSQGDRSSSNFNVPASSAGSSQAPILDDPLNDLLDELWCPIPTSTATPPTAPTKLRGTTTTTTSTTTNADASPKPTCMNEAPARPLSLPFKTEQEDLDDLLYANPQPSLSLELNAQPITMYPGIRISSGTVHPATRKVATEAELMALDLADRTTRTRILARLAARRRKHQQRLRRRDLDVLISLASQRHEQLTWAHRQLTQQRGLLLAAVRAQRAAGRL
ncbi:uncharacterized protein MONBRDRAFT_29601 [Monosiga brevicollis MX1]|uniref:Uncharacterized protein n=1 Tax=Monosiga brevicollis TaxID=81824 RepID=A9VBK4_MONBE|nr:uncharacterized protein MONBRDRAFT_29601 [Monosiga brevicollis MX1]EDQ85113.1 predicted protein [Monosiga brevicollis MX1]|eukprot:XP_001750117.1 hypothetical protein [Monosiga brevicollis MX1]